MKKILMFLVFGLMACGGDPGSLADGTEDAPSSVETEVSNTASYTEALTSEVECYDTWYCRRCGINSRQNVLYQECSDGTRTLVYTGPCGQACF